MLLDMVDKNICLGTEPELPELKVNVETHPVPDLHSYRIPASFACVFFMSIKSFRHYMMS